MSGRIRQAREKILVTTLRAQAGSHAADVARFEQETVYAVGHDLVWTPSGSQAGSQEGRRGSTRVGIDRPVVTLAAKGTLGRR